MKKVDAEWIIREAGRDRRLNASLNTKCARVATDQGFRVDLLLRARRLRITIKTFSEWEDIKMAWDGL